MNKRNVKKLGTKERELKPLKHAQGLNRASLRERLKAWNNRRKGEWLS